MEIFDLIWIGVGIVFVCFFLALFFTILRFYFFFKNSPEDFADLPQNIKASFKTVTLDVHDNFNRKKPQWEHQSASWQKAMLAEGELLVKTGVGGVYLIHGTGIGHDPLGLLTTLSRIPPRSNAKMSRWFGFQYESLKDLLLADYGQFCGNYLNLLSQSFKGQVLCRNFASSKKTKKLLEPR